MMYDNRIFISCFKLVVFVLVIGSLGLLCSEYRANSSLKSEIRDLREQLSESRQRPDTFYVRDSFPVWKERVVEIDRTDYKRIMADKELIKDLNLKVSQIEAENRMLRSTRDTVFLKEVDDSTLRYADKWVSFEYMTRDNRLSYAVRDSLTTLVTREYKHKILWGLIKWGTKGYNLFVVSHNPKCRVEYNKYIKVK